MHGRGNNGSDRSADLAPYAPGEFAAKALSGSTKHRAGVRQTADQANAKTYTLVIRDTSAGAEERYPNVSSDAKLLHPPTAKAEVIDQTVTPAA
jgi:hypothetical protein